MRRKTKKALKQSALAAFIMASVLVVLSLASVDWGNKPTGNRHGGLSEDVMDYKPVVETYAEKFGVSDHVHVLLAMMMQESGGRGNDPMQASESYCGSRGCINNPDLSIKQGVRYFSRTLEAADGDLKLAIQSYNFGQGFIDYVHAHSGTYSQDAAIAFSQQMYKAAADKSRYSCLRDEAKQYDACYGDIYYVRDVLEYRSAVAND
ncbi:lysozyme family protein [Lentibacillus lipolyticus]|nr:lysozyme family protein [Lentibacillus lipolyticus]